MQTFFNFSKLLAILEDSADSVFSLALISNTIFKHRLTVVFIVYLQYTVYVSILFTVDKDEKNKSKTQVIVPQHCLRHDSFESVM